MENDGIVLPARAGMSPAAMKHIYAPGCAPRASGDEPSKVDRSNMSEPCSPRERG